MKQLHRKDLFGWSEFNKERNLDFHSVLWVRDGGNVLIDPLPMSEHDHSHLQRLGGVNFIIRRQCQNVLRLLTNEDYAKAKEALSALRNLHPDHQFISQLHGFTQYLLTNTSGKIIHPTNNDNY